MKILTRLLALLLAYAIGLQPAVAQVQSAAIQQPGGFQAGPVAPIGVGVAGLQGSQVLKLPSLQLDANLNPAFSIKLSQSPAVSKTGVLRHAGSITATQAVLEEKNIPAQQSKERVQVARELRGKASAAEASVRDVEKLPSDGAQDAARRQFDVLTGEVGAQAHAASDSVPVSMAELRQTLRSTLLRADAVEKTGKIGKTEVPPAKGGITQVFKDPERNHAFWRYILGYSVFLFGFEMYMVGLPFLISSLTKNSLSEHHDPRQAVAESVNALIRQNRTLARIAHWTAQAVSYAMIPIFSRKADDGPRPWLVRSMLVRGAVLALVPAVFFASGILSMHAAIAVMLGLFAAQAFFQGITVTMESAAVARIIGDPSVTPAERAKANSIMTVVQAMLAIIAPALAGHISRIRDFFGKTGVGGAVIYGIYAAATAGAGLIFATIKMFAGKNKAAAAASALNGAEAVSIPSGIKGVLRHLRASLKDGMKLVWNNRFLRVMLGLSLINSLFSDPLIFNVLPEYIENIMKTHSSVGNLLHVPVLGWFLKGLTSTPMGYFSFLLVLSSLGSMAAAALNKPLRNLLAKFGFSTEESLVRPFYILAALEIPLFWLMMSWPSMVGVLLLYGMQTLATAFGSMTVSGLHQKVLGGYEDQDVNKLLAAQSLVSIIAAIASTFVYGFLLKDIAIKTSMLIAGIAIAVQGAARLIAPWFAFTKEQRQRQPGTQAAGKS